jgi:hypothetical protein
MDIAGAFRYQQGRAEMAEAEQAGVMPEPITPEQPQAGATPATVDPAEYAKVLAALKEANKEAADRRKKLNEYEAAEQKRIDAGKTDLEKAQSERDAANKALMATNKKLIAIKYSLPAEFADRIVGQTLEEMDADGEKLAAALPKKEPERVSINPTNIGSGPVKATTAQWREFMFGNGPLPGA